MLTLQSISFLQNAIERAPDTNFAERGKLIIGRVFRYMQEQANVANVEQKLALDIHEMIEELVRAYEFDDLGDYLGRYAAQMSILQGCHNIGGRIEATGLFDNNPFLPTTTPPNIMVLDRCLMVANEIEVIFNIYHILSIEVLFPALADYGVPRNKTLLDIVENEEHPDHKFFKTMMANEKAESQRLAMESERYAFVSALEEIRKELFGLTYPKTKQGENLRAQATGMISNLMTKYK